MIIEAEFEQNDIEIESDFESINNISDGGFERGYTQGYDEGYKVGEVESNGHLWEYVRGYDRLFYQSVLPTGYSMELDLYPKYNAKVIDIEYMFSKTTGLVQVKMNDKGSEMGLRATRAFQETSIEILDLTNAYKIRDFANAFEYSNLTIEILGELDFSDAVGVTNAFNGASRLEEIRLKPNTLKLSLSFASSSKLTDESIQSIIDGLADLKVLGTS